MKSYLKNILALGAVSVLFSCQSEMEPVGPAVDFEPKVLVAKVDDNVKADDEPSRTSLAEGRMVRWSSSDRIVAFEDENPTLSDENTTVTDNGAIASFTFSQTPLETNFFWALYPADMTATYDWAEIHTAGIPVEQRAVAGSFANNANLAVADATVDDDVQFKNIGALLSLSFTSTKKISSIILKTTEETLAGSVLIEPETLDFVVDEGSGEVTLTKVNATSGTYYFVVYPGTYEGIDVIFRSTDGGRAAYHSSATLTIGRNEVMFIRDFQIKDSKWEMIPQVPGAWIKVTDVSDLADGDEIVITDEDAAYAISTTQNTNNRSAVAVTASADGNTIEINDDVQIITLEASGDNWKFNVGTDQYLYAAGGSNNNHLKTASASTAGDNGKWALTTSSAIAQGDAARNSLRYNNSSTLFSCYASGQKAIAFYKNNPGRDAQEYTITIVDRTLGTVTTDPADKAYETQTVTITPVPADESYAMTSVTVVDDEDNEITVTDNTFVMPSGNVTITPVFSAGLKTVTTVAENGSISVEPGTAVAPETEVTITAVPDAGYEFVSWSVTGATPASTTANPTTFTMPDSDVTVTATFKKAAGWIETPLSSISSSDVFVIVANDKYALPHDGNSAPVCISVTVSEGRLTGTIPENVQWNLTGSSTDGYTFYPNGSTSKYLRCTTTASSSSNDNLRVSTGARNVFTVDSDGHIMTKDNYTTRIIGLNGTSNFRGYVTATSGTEAIFKFYALEDNTTWNLKGIAVTTPPTKTTYEAGEDFDATGMVVTATYEDADGIKDDKEVVLNNADLTITPSTKLTAGTNSVTITYEGKSTTQAITVVEWVLDSIEITTPPTKTTYAVGDSFVATGMVVTAHYIDNGGSSYTKDETVDNNQLNISPVGPYAEAGDVIVTVTYGGFSDTVDIEVVAEVTEYAITFSQPSETGCSIAVTVGGASISSGDSFEEGTVVTLEATAGDGYEFSAWTVTGATPADASAATTTFTVGSTDVEISASFVEAAPTEKEYYILDAQTTTIATSNSYAAVSNASCATGLSNPGSYPSTASWSITLGSKQTNSPSGLWWGSNSGQKAKMILSNGNIAGASAIATALGVTTSATYYAALICSTSFANISRVDVTIRGTGGATSGTIYLLRSTDGGTTYSKVGEASYSSGNLTPSFTIASPATSAIYALAFHVTAWGSIKAPVVTFYTLD